MSDIAATPEPPYYAVIFTSLGTGEDQATYDETSDRMFALAAEQPGYLGVETAHEGIGITVSYWESLEAIAAWKAVAEHREAQRMGRERWYRSYTTRICRVERDYRVDIG